MNHDTMWPGQIRRDGHGNLWICTDRPKGLPRWDRVTGYTGPGADQFLLSEDDDTAILWDIEDEPIRPQLPVGQIRLGKDGTAWQKVYPGTVWTNTLVTKSLADDDVRDLQIIWTPEDQ